MSKFTRVACALAAFATFALMTAAASPAAQASGSCDVTDLSIDSEEQSFLQLINAYRAKSNLAPLTLDPALNRAATWMATDLASRQGFSHTDSLGRSPWVRMPDCGVSWPGGENLAAGSNYSSAHSALSAWINSPSHRDVMLTATFKTIGISRVYREGSYYGWYWVTDFGYVANDPAPAPAATPQPTLAPPAPQPIAPASSSGPAPIAPPAPVQRTLSLASGLSLVTWEGDYLSPDEVFGPASNWVVMVYVFDLNSQQWLRWSPALAPELRSLTQLRSGVQYWVITSRAVDVPMN